ncbi:MAG: translation initiation factor IF-2 [bacterium]
MNVTELARNLRTTANELFEHLPNMGFDIGRRAIKVDDRIAARITRAWRPYKDKLALEQKKLQDDKKIQQIREQGPIKIPSAMVVRDFAAILDLPIAKILSELMKNGIATSLNERLDFETAAILAEDMGIEVVLDEDEQVKSVKPSMTIKDILEKQTADVMQKRPPVVVIMGHVDHGKTKLLDAIRDTHVIESESGGITQHIGAYQAWATSKDNKNIKEIITFVDTPGHEAFTAMRSRGAKIADIAILVIAADDSIMPQTTEAYKIIEQAKIPMIVAINKIDKPEANIEKVKQDLSSRLNILPEDWGGKTICVPISAKQNTNLDQLLEMILLVAEMEEKKIKANPNTNAAGTVIEAHLDKGEGPVATILIQNGTLKIGEYIIIDEMVYGKVKTMKDFHGNRILEAEPSTPVRVLGLKIAPHVGDIVQSSREARLENKKLKRERFYQSSTIASGSVVARKKRVKENDDEKEDNQINVILKADVLGSLEAIIESISKIEHPEIKVNIISKGLGNINEADILRAESCDGLVIGFHALPTHQAKMLADDKKIEIGHYKIIYKLLDDIKTKIEAKISPEIIKHDLGQFKVLALFKQNKDNQIVGGKVERGKIEKKAEISIWRNDVAIGKTKFVNLKNGKEEVNEVAFGQECGLEIESKTPIEEGDVLEFYREEKKAVKL